MVGLTEYFQHIFGRINDDYLEETARLFLACQKATKPLPLPAFGVVINNDPADVTLSCPIDENYNWNSPAFVKTVRAQVNGRCQDLLAVEPSHGYPPHHIEFLHRSVKEFLEEPNIYEQLTTRAGAGFDADAALFSTYVLLVKMAMSWDSYAQTYILTWSAQWSDLALLHASQMTGRPSYELVSDLDETMSRICRDKRHWANSMSRGAREDGHRDLMGHLISAGLVPWVRDALARDPRQTVRKKGRPYLDYALRYTSQQSDSMTFASLSDRRAIDRRVAMVKTLLDHGAAVSQRIYAEDNRTIWDLYLVHLLNDRVEKNEGREVLWALIAAGARDLGKCEVAGSREATMKEVLAQIFGSEEAEEMCQAISKNEPSGAIQAAWGWLRRGPLRDLG